MWKTNLKTKRRNWMGDISLWTMEKVFVNVRVTPGSSWTRAAGSYQHNYTTAG